MVHKMPVLVGEAHRSPTLVPLEDRFTVFFRGEIWRQHFRRQHFYFEGNIL